MSDMTKTLWGQFMTAFQDQIKIEGVPQMLTGPTPWNWGCLLYTSPSPRDS